jgi:hypothetical protein
MKHRIKQQKKKQKKKKQKRKKYNIIICTKIFNRKKF